MKTKVTVLPALFFIVSLSPLPAFADELIKFKSGYEMMVVSHREEKDMVIVTLDGGGEVGFPKDALEMLESGKTTTRTGPSPHLNRVFSRVNARQFEAPLKQMPSRFLAKGAATLGGVTVGYSKNGKGQQRFSGGPLEMASANGKIGVDVRTRGRIRNHEGSGEEQAEAGKSQIRTLDAIIPTSKEGE